MARVRKYQEEGFAIKRMMRLRSVTPKDIAARFNFLSRTLNNYLRGVSRFPPELHQSLAEYLDCTLEELFPPATSIPSSLVLPEQKDVLRAHPRPLLTPSTHVIQLEGQQLVMPYEVPGFSFAQPEMISNVVAWFGDRIVLMQSLARGWSPGTSYDQLHALVQAELETWNLLPMTEEMKITRRTALSTLAVVAPPLLKQIATGSLAASVLGEFFAQATISMDACWELLHNDGFDIAAQRLPTYLPLLESLSYRSSPYQRVAARLATQGYRLASLLALNKNQMQQSYAFLRKGVVVSEISQDANIQATSLRHLAAFLIARQAEIEEANPWTASEAHQVLQQALPIVNNPRNKINPQLRGMILLGFGTSKMHLTHSVERDAVASIEDAKALFAEYPASSVSYVDPVDYLLYQWEGLAYLAAGDLETAKKVFANLDTLDPSKIAKRSRLQLVNYRALLALKMGDLDAFNTFMLDGIAGARAIGSQKRKQEIVANWHAAVELYPREPIVLNLAQQIMR